MSDQTGWDIPGITPMKWVTPEVTSAFPLILAAALIDSGLVRSRNELQTLQRSLENWKANCFEDHPRLTRNERHMVALLEAFLLRGLRGEDVLV